MKQKSGKRIELKMNPLLVMGNVYISKEIQSSCKDGEAVVPISITVVRTGNSKEAIVHFANSSGAQKLALCQFLNPPSIEELKRQIPCEEKEIPFPRVKTNWGRYNHIPRFE